MFVDESVDKVWRPKNDTNTFLGPIRMREALYKSRNLVSIRLLQAMGVDRTIDYIAKFGFNKQDLPRNLSLALGTATLTPMEIATGWSTFANGGYKITPYLIERIESRSGETLFTANPARVPQGAQDQAGLAAPEQPISTAAMPGEAPSALSQVAAAPQAPAVAEQIIDGRTTYILTSMLQDVIKRGTGRRALALGRTDLAGKTGTTNESKDAWFSGYNADYVTTVWVGFDQPETLGRREYGGTAALPIWMNFMGAALKDKPAHAPAEPEAFSACASTRSAGARHRRAPRMPTSSCSKPKIRRRRWTSWAMARHRAARCQPMKRRRWICSKAGRLTQVLRGLSI